MTEKQKQQINSQVEAIRVNKNESSTLKASIKRLYGSADKIAKKLSKLFDDNQKKAETELSNLRSSYQKEVSKTKAQTKEDRDEVSSIRKQARSEYNRFSTTYKTATNKQNGVQARYEKIVKLHKDSQTLHNDISKNETSSKNYTAKIKDLHASSKKNEKNISDINDRATVIQEQIEETYGITIDTTLAGTLKTRKDELLPRVRNWERVYIGSLVILSAAIIIALAVDRPSSFTEVITERIVFLTPLLFIAFVASRQFAHERRLLEEYAFKAAAAQALKGYTILLAEQFKDSPNAESQIIEFTVGAMKGIYDRSPLEQKTGLLYQISFGNKLGKIEGKIQEIVREEISKVSTNSTASVDVTTKASS